MKHVIGYSFSVHFLPINSQTVMTIVFLATIKGLAEAKTYAQPRSQAFRVRG